MIFYIAGAVFIEHMITLMSKIKKNTQKYVKWINSLKR